LEGEEEEQYRRSPDKFEDEWARFVQDEGKHYKVMPPHYQPLSEAPAAQPEAPKLSQKPL